MMNLGMETLLLFVFLMLCSCFHPLGLVGFFFSKDTIINIRKLAVKMQAFAFAIASLFSFLFCVGVGWEAGEKGGILMK